METTTSSGLGLDFGFFNEVDRVLLISKRHPDLIFPVPAAATQPGPPSLVL
jgi:iron complex outermembrane receptor protein